MAWSTPGSALETCSLKTRCALLFAGAAAWALCATAAAVEKSVYSDDFNTGTLSDRTQWSFGQVSSGAPVLMSTTPQSPVPLPLRFLAEFGGNDTVHLNLPPLPQDTVSVRLQFDAYLLRSWDGQDVPYGGPDVFGYGISGRHSRSSTTASAMGRASRATVHSRPRPACASRPGAPMGDWKDKLGVNVELDPAEGSTIPAKGTPMSLVYHFDTGPIAYSGGAITFDFFSRGLQVHDDQPNKVIDESWGLDNVVVTAQVVPEPATVALPAGWPALAVLRSSSPQPLSALAPGRIAHHAPGGLHGRVRSASASSARTSHGLRIAPLCNSDRLAARRSRHKPPGQP